MYNFLLIFFSDDHDTSLRDGNSVMTSQFGLSKETYIALSETTCTVKDTSCTLVDNANIDKPSSNSYNDLSLKDNTCSKQK